MSAYASQDTPPVPPQSETDENNMHFIKEYRQAFTTHLQWLLSLAGAKEIIKEQKDVFIILLILAAIYGFHLWTIPRSVKPEHIRRITNYFIIPNLILVLFILILSYIIVVPWKWELIGFSVMVITAVSLIRAHPTFWNQMKQSLEATWNRVPSFWNHMKQSAEETWNRVRNRWKPSANHRTGSDATDQRDENGTSGDGTNTTTDNDV